jgi:hypothetical protein
MGPEITYEPVRVATTRHAKAEDGFLIFTDGALVAVITNLDWSVGDYGHLRGRWFLEAGFGPCAVLPGDECIFETPHAARKWVLRQLLERQPA